jgi:hypothetical protein
MSRKKKQQQSTRTVYPPAPEVRRGISPSEVILILFVVIIVLGGVGFLVFENQIKERFPELKQDDSTTTKPTATPSGTTSSPTTEQESDLTYANPITWVAIGLGAMLFLAIIIKGVLTLQMKRNADQLSSFEQGVRLNALKDVSSTMLEVIMSMAIPTGLFIIAAVMHKLKWTKARDYLLGTAYLMFIIFVVRETLARGHSKNKTRLIAVVPAGILICLGMYFQYIKEKDFATIFYMMGLGTFLVSLGYLNYLDWRKNLWEKTKDFFSPTKRAEQMTEAITSAPGAVKEYMTETAMQYETVKGLVDWWYQEPPATPEEEKAKEQTLWEWVVEKVSGDGTVPENEKQEEAEGMFQKVMGYISGNTEEEAKAEVEEEQEGVMATLASYIPQGVKDWWNNETPEEGQQQEEEQKGE